MIINYDLVRSNRKSICITVERDAEVVLNAPLELNIEEIEKHIHKKRFWILEKLALKKSIAQNLVQKKFISGENFAYLGRNYRLQIVDDSSDLKLKNGWFFLGKNAKIKAKDIFKNWYVEHLKIKISERLDIVCKAANIAKPDFRVIDLGFRWGSCTKEGALNFNWKIAMAPLGVIDYILIHEIAHLKEHTHNERFWKEVSKLMPEYATKKEWLKENGYSMDI